MLVGFQLDSAKSKKQMDEVDEPTYESMRAANNPSAQRRNLTKDERAVKRKMHKNQRTAAGYSGPGYYLVNETGEPQSERYVTLSQAEADLEPDSGHLIQFVSQQPASTHVSQPFPAQLQQVNGSRNMRETEILTAMAKATPDEAAALAADLEGLRAKSRLAIQADREVALADAYINDVMHPVAVHEHVTASTDWLGTVAEPNIASEHVNQLMISEASNWFNNVSPEVRADVEEFSEQAKGKARRVSSSLGSQANAGYETFMFTAGRLLKQAWGDGGVPEGFITPWSSPPQVLPPTSKGHAPFGVPSDSSLSLNMTPLVTPDPYLQEGGALNGVNYNPMAEEMPDMGVALPLDNGNAAWPPAQNLEGEPGLPSMVAPDGYDPTGGTSKMPDDEANTIDDDLPNTTTASRRIAANSPYTQLSLMPHEVKKGDKILGMPDHDVMGVSYAGDGGAMGDQGGLWHIHTKHRVTGKDGVIPRYGNSYSTVLRPNPVKTSSQNFNGPKQTFEDYNNRKDAGSYPLDEEHWAGSMSAVSPSPDNTTIPVVAMHRWADRGFKPDPHGDNLGKNPMAGYPDGNTPAAQQQIHEQYGGAASSLPFAPDSPEIKDGEWFDWLTDYPNTGPTEVTSDRAFNVGANSGEDEDQDAQNDRMKASLSALHLAEVTKFAEDLPGRGVDQKGKTYEPDRSQYARTPQGQAESTEGYEEAYSSNRHIDYSQTGETGLGTVPVQGYGTNEHGEMFNANQWLQEAPGTGAAAVSNVPTPGIQGGPGDPDDLNQPQYPEGKEGRLLKAKMLVQKNLR